MERNWSTLCLSPAFWGRGLTLAWKALLAPYVADGPTASLILIATALVAAFSWNCSLVVRHRTGLLRLIAAVGMAASFVIVGHAFGTFDAPALLVLASAGANTCVNLLIIMAWSQVFARMPMALTGLVLGISYIAGAAFFFLCQLLPAGVQAGCALLLAPASVGCVSLCGALLDGRDSRSHDSAGASGETGAGRCGPAASGAEPPATEALLRSYPWRMVLVIAFFAFAVGINRVHSTPLIDVFGAGLAGVIITACTALAAVRVNPFVLYRTIIPVMLAGMLISILAGPHSLPAQIAANASYAFAHLLLTLLLCDKAYRFGTPILFTYGIGRACMGAAYLLGTLCAEALESWLSFNPLFSVEVLYGIVLLGSIVAILSWVSGREYLEAFHGGTTGAGESGDAEACDRAAAAPVPDAGAAVVPAAPSLSGGVSRTALLQAMIGRRCERIAAEYRLSKRESEILVLLAWGKSSRRIEETLCLSPNTVKTHVRHIYAKLGIHSRAELDALVDAADS